MIHRNLDANSHGASRWSDPSEARRAAGIVLIGAAWLWVSLATPSSMRTWQHLLAAAGVVLAAGGARSAGRRDAALSAQARIDAPGSGAPDGWAQSADLVERYTQAFAFAKSGRRWAAFDQFVRETLAREIGATHVRCYHLRADGEGLTPLGDGSSVLELESPDIAGGAIAQALATGRPFTRLSDETADDADPAPYAAIWPIVEGAHPIGLITIGALGRCASADEAAVCRAVRGLVTWCWLHEAARESLREARRTDQSSGLLRREAFFKAARDALDASQQRGEPVVMAAVALEGLRGLDDGKDWRTRDALIERLGRTLSQRLRADDLVGRFSDDRYVLLLRRMNVGLGRLLAGKLLDAVHAELREFNAPPGSLAVRIGVAGGAGRSDQLDRLLADALDAVVAARRAGLPLKAPSDGPGEELA